MKNSSILSAKNIHKTFTNRESPILSGVSLEVSPGESHAITGASGEGKTTLLHILGTLESFDQGDLSILGNSIQAKDNSLIRNQHIGFIFQFYNLLEDFSLLENILIPIRIARKPLDNYLIKAKSLLEEVGLKDQLHQKAKTLSGGEKQRAAIARALINNPDLILADEPSGSLDHKNSEIIHELLLDLVKKSKKSLVLVTHDEELAALCDNRYLLRDQLLHKN